MAGMIEVIVCVLTFYLYVAADIISTVEFNHDGEFLATGDKGGRVVIFQRDGTKMRVRLNESSERFVFPHQRQALRQSLPCGPISNLL